MLRVLFNSPNPSLHGGPANHLPLLRAALERYVEIELFSHGRATDRETCARKILRTGINLASVYSKIRRRPPDVIHVNSSFDARGILRDTPLAWLAARLGIPLLLKAHGSLSEMITPTRTPVELAKKSLLSNISVLCVLSEAEKQEFEHFLPQLRGRVRVVKNIICDTFVDVRRCESAEPLVLFASRFLKRKGPFQLLNAVPYILQRVPNTQFVFLGDGPDAAEFDAEIIARRMGAVVRRLPYVTRDEMKAWYTRAWVFVFPTLFPEGMPMVIAEAMATGTPIITAPIRFCSSYMVEHDNCLYCEPQNPESIAQQVVTLLGNSGMRDKMSQATRLLARQFGSDTVAREFVELYKQLARSSHEPALQAPSVLRYFSRRPWRGLVQKFADCDLRSSDFFGGLLRPSSSHVDEPGPQRERDGRA